MAYAMGINEAGKIVGRYQTADGHGHYFLFDGNYTGGDFPGASHTVGDGINSQGDIVGSYTPGNNFNSNYGFVKDSTGFSVIDASSIGAVLVTQARGINDAGEVVGGYTD